MEKERKIIIIILLEKKKNNNEKRDFYENICGKIFTSEPFLAGNQLHELPTHGWLVSKKNHYNFRLETVTFEPRHENKTCSACRERVDERMREYESVRDEIV